MAFLRTAVVSILAASLCAYATAAELIAGPWVVLTPDGGARIGAEWSVAVELASQAKVHLGNRVVSLAATQRPCRRDGQTNTSVTEIIVPPAFRAGPFRWEIAGRTLPGVLPVLPAPDTPVRVAVVGAYNYPDGLALGRLAVMLGGHAVDVVVLAGPDRQRVLGRGGWEHAIPLILLSDGVSDDALDAIAPASRWSQGVVWGCLGLSCAHDDADWPGAIASQLCTWRIPLLSESRWDPGLLASVESHEPDALRPLVDLASGLQVPAILQFSGRAGFISEPLLNQAGVLRSVAGGVRILGATPAGEGMAGLSETIATPLPGTAVVGLLAAPGKLLLAVAGGDEPPVELVWERAASGELSGPGTGAGDAREAWEAWRKGDESRLAEVAWAAIPGLQRIVLTSDDDKALIAASNAGSGRMVARRYLGRPDGGPLPDGAPAWLVRERALRELGRNVVLLGGTAAVALEEGSDDEVLHAAVRCLEGPQRGLLLDLLTERLRRFGKDGAPEISDPLICHRVVAAVFGAPDRSPTPLRPIALDLSKRWAPQKGVDGALFDKYAFERGPVVRFLARHGEIRK